MLPPPLQKARGWGTLGYDWRFSEGSDGMIDRKYAESFAEDWIAAWNSHDLERILAHYSDDFEMSSPFIALIGGEPSGKLRGKKAVREYWAKALQMHPGLHFNLAATLVGAASITLYYEGVRGMVAEVVHFGPDGKVAAAFAHYTA